jgi:DNA-binding NarL/FixJ family response regulator
VFDFVLRSVLLVEDDRGYGALIADNLTHRGYRVTLVGDVAEALTQAETDDFDIVVADVYLGSGPTGFDLVEQLNRNQPDLPVVFLTNLKDPKYLVKDGKFKFKQAAYIHKDRLIDPNYLGQVLAAVLSGQVSKNMRQDIQPSSALGELTNTQLQMLRYMASGMSNQEIADLRGTTLRASEMVQLRIFQALGIDSSERSTARSKAVQIYLKEAGLHKGFDFGA